MAEIKIQADLREKVGVKGELSKIRAAQKVPAVVYGGKKEPVSIAITQKDLAAILKGGANTIVAFDTPAGKETAIVKDIQYHVVKDTPNHVDFQRISMTDKIEIVVPVKLTGESAEAKMYGAMVNQVLREIHVICFPADIPHDIVVNIADLTVQKPITIADLNLSDKVEVVGGTDRAIVHLMLPREEEEAAADSPTAPESSSTKGKKDEDGKVAKK